MFDPNLPDDDSDILGGSSNSSRSYKDGTFSFKGPGGKNFNIPDHIVKEISALLEESFNSGGLSMVQNVMIDMFDHFTSLGLFASSGPMLAAVAEVLDNQTAGLITLMTQLRDAERTIMWCHKALRSQNRVLSEIDYEKEDINKEIYKSKFFLLSFVELVQFTLADAIETYKSLCHTLEREPDELLMDAGYYSNRDIYAKIGMLRPPAKGGV